ncbi:MAG: flagellar basal body rod protein FlgB [Magnetococcales bacterium]|nr:flagellar basal body rod protein FlgB [Magnetococcales bacterium]MBF0322584.1 flagellar basal body rod protein FlgB [Magnetococcales bacterium]
MSDMGLLGATGAFKKNLLELRQRRQEIITSNVANVDTPGYKARRLDFEAELAEAMPPPPGELALARTDGRHLPTTDFTAASGNLQEVEGAIAKGDGNTVDIEQEMSRQTANQLLYNYAAQSMAGQISRLRMVIDAGK